MKGGLFSGLVALSVAIAGCDLVLDVGAYHERPGSSPAATSSSGGEGVAGGGGTGSSASSTVSSTSAGMPDPCYKEQEAVYISDDHEIVGHQGRCTAAQLADFTVCVENHDFDCLSFYGEPANSDCGTCIRSFTANPIIAALLSALGVASYYAQVTACEAVTQGKEHCLEAVQLDFCRVTACEGCYDDEEAYDACFGYAVEYGCPEVTLPVECESIFYLTPPCNAETVEERVITTATILCGD
jgi:hypothetical protein